MTDVEVHIDLEGMVRPLGRLRRQVSRRSETVTFEYDTVWLETADRFSIEPALAERIERDEETEDDLRLIFAPGSSLGGARPKASVIDRYGRLSMAKFPKISDDYSLETWEEVAFRLAERADIEVPVHQLLKVAGKPVFLSRRFDRTAEGWRVPFLSAMAMTGSRDGERGSYPELVDALAAHGAWAKADSRQLYRRVAFNVLVSNVDDHLRNHGFLWAGQGGWVFSPAYDLNPTPVDIKARILTTNIDLDEGTCSVDLLLEAAEYFGLGIKPARAIIREVAEVTRTWRVVAEAVGAPRAKIGATPPPTVAFKFKPDLKRLVPHLVTHGFFGARARNNP